MARLLPQMKALAGQVKQGLPNAIVAGGTSQAGAVPSLAAAQAMSTGTTPLVRSTVAARFIKVAETVEAARRAFLITSEQLVSVVNAVPTLQPPQP